MKRILFASNLLLLLGAAGSSQPYYTLQAAIDTVLSLNLDVRQ